MAARRRGTGGEGCDTSGARNRTSARGTVRTEVVGGRGVTTVADAAPAPASAARSGWPGDAAAAAAASSDAVAPRPSRHVHFGDSSAGEEATGGRGTGSERDVVPAPAPASAAPADAALRLAAARAAEPATVPAAPPETASSRLQRARRPPARFVNGSSPPVHGRPRRRVAATSDNLCHAPQKGSKRRDRPSLRCQCARCPATGSGPPAASAHTQAGTGSASHTASASHGGSAPP